VLGAVLLYALQAVPASDVVSKLAGLEPDERDAIEAYELSGRKRRTILGKLEQLKSQDR